MPKLKLLNRSTISAVLLGLATAVAGESALAQGPVVRGILFFAPTCPHCHEVINGDLPTIFGRFGGQPRLYFDTTAARGELAFYAVTNGQVEILLVDASKPAGYNIFRAATERFEIESNGVPRLIVGDSVLIGSLDIPRQLPRLIEQGLAGDGIDWPDIVGLQTALASIPGPLLAAAEPETAAGGEVAAEASPEPETTEAAPAAQDPQPEAPNEAAPQAQPETQPAAGGEDTPEPRPGEAEAAAAEDTTGREATPEERPSVTTPVPEPGGTNLGPTAVPGSEREADEASAVEDETVSEAEVDSTLALIPIYRPTMIELYRQDPVGNSVSVLVLIGMVLSFVVFALIVREPSTGNALPIAVPLIAVVGIVVATYLTYIESSGVTAVCGPVGDCNTVNQSEYARLFGVIPVAALGLASYVVVILAWSVARLGSGTAADWAKLGILAIGVIGTLFSIYLTFLEPFVIGATCAWCLTSAVAITALMLLSARPGFEAWARIRTR